MKRIIYTNTQDIMVVLIPSPNWTGTMDELATKDVKNAVDVYEIVDTTEVPSDRTFRNAWKRGEQGKKVGIDMAKGKEITHARRRTKRDEEMGPHDKIIMKQIPGQNTNQAEAARAQLRIKYASIQDDIDNATTPEALKTIIDAEEL